MDEESNISWIAEALIELDGQKFESQMTKDKAEQIRVIIENAWKELFQLNEKAAIVNWAVPPKKYKMNKEIGIPKALSRIVFDKALNDYLRDVIENKINTKVHNQVGRLIWLEINEKTRNDIKRILTTFSFR